MISRISFADRTSRSDAHTFIVNRSFCFASNNRQSVSQSHRETTGKASVHQKFVSFQRTSTTALLRRPRPVSSPLSSSSSLEQIINASRTNRFITIVFLDPSPPNTKHDADVMTNERHHAIKKKTAQRTYFRPIPRRPIPHRRNDANNAIHRSVFPRRTRNPRRRNPKNKKKRRFIFQKTVSFSPTVYDSSFQGSGGGVQNFNQTRKRDERGVHLHLPK